MGLALGIDFGTSGVRACALDADGICQGEAAVPLPPLIEMVAGGPETRHPGMDGCGEQDPALWWAALRELLTQLSAKVSLTRLRAIAIDGTSGTLVVCDESGRPLHPALMYNDARAIAEAARIATIAPRESGAHGATSSLAKLLWLRARGMPETARALHQAEWIAGRLLGRFDQGDENNALKLGYDVIARRWPDWLSALDVNASHLPRAREPGTPLGTVAPEVARTLGLSPDTLIVAGATDSIAATLASGATRTGDAVTTLGTTIVLKVFSDHPVFAPEFGIYSHRLGEIWLAGGASNSGGAVLRQFFDDAALADLSDRIVPERDSGLDYYPLPAPGERFPVADPTLAPRISPRPADDARFLHGLLEGMARIERDGYHRLATLGAPWPTRVLTMGGGARNPAWSAIRARLLGMPVSARADAIPACGAARLALRGMLSPKARLHTEILPETNADKAKPKGMTNTE
ncbi:MAG: FGGY-family carbohydrate kinase [Pseudomonadota bacterium]